MACRYYYSKSILAIAPIFYGSGIKLKVLDALAYNKPIITIIGIEGINNDLFDADMILIADKKDFLFNYNLFVSSYRSNKTLIKYFDFPLLLKIKLIEC